MYAAGEYDLAGFAVGAVEREALPSADRVREGDVIIGLPSSGLHSNGYSLARRALLEVRGLALHEPMPGSEISLGEIMLAPTRIYVRPVLSVLKTLSASVHGMAHITGGGLVENIPRVLPEGLEIRMQWDAWDVPAIFKEVQAAGVSDTEMRRTFNLGIGFVLVVAPAEVDAVCDALRAEGETPHCIGEVTRAGS